MKQNCRPAIAVFLVVAGFLTMTINSWNAQRFGLQNATVAALVEHKTFALVDQVIPGFNLVEGTETFRFNKSVYPMKQPGGTVIGAMVYYPLYRLGITYRNHFDYVSHLVTFGTSTLMIALASVVIYLLSLEITRKKWSSIAAALLFALSTMIWPYAGVSHHDIYGVFFGLLGLYFYILAHTDNNGKYLFLAGFFATFTLFFTMLPLTLPLVFAGMILATRKLRDFVVLSTGMVIGVLPTVLFNASVFGNPWLPPNLAGQVSDTMPLLSVSNFASKLWFYLGAPTSSIFLFTPLVLFGIAGIWSLAKKDRWLKCVLILIPALQLVHVASMETFGGYQYGPRYLLPTLGCLMLGVAIWLSRKHAQWEKVVFVLAALYSITVSALGAIQTVMYPMPGPYAPAVFLNQVSIGTVPIFRMWIPGLFLLLSGMVLFYCLYREDKQRHD